MILHEKVSKILQIIIDHQSSMFILSNIAELDTKLIIVIIHFIIFLHFLSDLYGTPC